jgi:hypothetical protein
MVLREAFPAGIVAYDFLGADDVWKRDWTAEARPHFWLFVFRRGPKLRTLYFTKFRVVPWIKNMFRACRAVAARMRRRVLPH